jgi:L,D-transpeptidase catalytic domain
MPNNCWRYISRTISRLAFCSMGAVLLSCAASRPPSPSEFFSHRGGKADDSRSARQSPQVAVRPPAPHEWWGDGVSGVPSVRINLATQKAEFYKGGQLVGWTTVATGKPGYETPTGTYHILDKQLLRTSNTYGMIVGPDGDIRDYDARSGRERIPAGGRFEGSPMPYWMQVTGSGHGMHAGIIPQPGLPASHGCIRMPREMAETFYRNAPPGTRVSIVKDYSEKARNDQILASYSASAH